MVDRCQWLVLSTALKVLALAHPLWNRAEGKAWEVREGNEKSIDSLGNGFVLGRRAAARRR